MSHIKNSKTQVFQHGIALEPLKKNGRNLMAVLLLGELKAKKEDDNRLGFVKIVARFLQRPSPDLFKGWGLWYYPYLHARESLYSYENLIKISKAYDR